MLSEAHNPAHELRRIIADGHISIGALHAMTDIQPEKLRFFISDAATGMAGPTEELSSEESMRLTTLAAQLTDGLQIGDDERLKAIFESLTIECRLTLQNIARLTGLDVDELEGVLRDPCTVPIEKKYEVAIRGSYLINAVNRARGQ